MTDLPVGVGFGVRRPEQAAWVAGFADAVVVGSAIVRLVEESTARRSAPARVGALRRASLRGGDAAPRAAQPERRRGRLRRDRRLAAAASRSRRGWDLKLERMRAALARPRPSRARVSRACTSPAPTARARRRRWWRRCCAPAGVRTGLYTSPHLVDFAERIRAGGRTIPHDAVVGAGRRAAGRARAARASRSRTSSSSTLLAFEWFARIGVDVGGGRGRARRTARRDQRRARRWSTAITSIAHDHEEWLGRELRQIAAEKAGIAEARRSAGGRPAAGGGRRRRSPRARRPSASPVVRAGRDGWLEADGGLAFRGAGRRRRRRRPGARPRRRVPARQRGGGAPRSSPARAPAFACERDGGARRPRGRPRGPAGSRWSGAAPAGASSTARTTRPGVAALAAELPGLVGGRRLVLVFAVMADKAWPAMLESLLPHAARWSSRASAGAGSIPAASSPRRAAACRCTPIGRSARRAATRARARRARRCRGRHRVALPGRRGVRDARAGRDVCSSPGTAGVGDATEPPR